MSLARGEKAGMTAHDRGMTLLLNAPARPG